MCPSEGLQSADPLHRVCTATLRPDEMLPQTPGGLCPLNPLEDLRSPNPLLKAHSYLYPE